MTAPEVGPDARPTARALEVALRTLEPMTGPEVGSLTGQAAIVRSSCLDAADVLGAFDRMLLRPLTPDRAVGVRRMAEAALTQAAECAADCRALGDRVGAVDDVADGCESVAEELRRFLSQLVDASVQERSSAT